MHVVGFFIVLFGLQASNLGLELQICDLEIWQFFAELRFYVFQASSFVVVFRLP